jgi:hypothetical protein
MTKGIPSDDNVTRKSDSLCRLSHFCVNCPSAGEGGVINECFLVLPIYPLPRFEEQLAQDCDKPLTIFFPLLESSHT